MTTPSSITIKIDFGPERIAGFTSNVSLQGDIPTPFSAGGLSSGISGQPADTLPTPFDNPAQSVAALHGQPPAPSSGLTGLTDSAGSVPSPAMDSDAKMLNEDALPRPETIPDSAKK
jgi:hypothetical protein